MKVHTNIKAGGLGANHNEKQSKSLAVKTGIKAGGLGTNHNEKQSKGFVVKTGIKAGFNPQPDPPAARNHNEKLVGDAA